MGYNKGLFFFIFLFAILIIIPPVSSIDSLGIFEKSTNVELLQICSNSTALCEHCNISSVYYPNSTLILSDIEMTKRNYDFNYTLLSNYTSALGSYSVNGFCIAGSQVKVFSYNFEVTENGNEKPDGIIVVLFSILFLILCAGMTGLLMHNLFMLIDWNLDARDLIYNISAYFVLFAAYILGKQYMGNAFINDFSLWAISVGSLTNVILPIIGFVMSYFKNGWSNVENAKR